MIKENIHLIRRQELRRGLHVVVSKAVVMRVRVLPVQHGMVMHPAGLISRHIHRCGFCVARFVVNEYPGRGWSQMCVLYQIFTVSIYSSRVMLLLWFL